MGSPDFLVIFDVGSDIFVVLIYYNVLEGLKLTANEDKVYDETKSLLPMVL